MTAEVGWYLYAFLSHGDLPPLTGIDGRSPLGLLAEDGVSALASAVPLAEFGEEALRRNLQDLRWLEEKVRIHESIVEAALARGPLLPMRFGAIFLDPGTIRALIRRKARPIREALEFLGDKAEWGVKGLADRAALRASVVRGDPALRALSLEASARPPGQGYLLRRKVEDLASAKAREREELLARDFLETVEHTVVDLAARPPLLPDTPGGEKVVFNLACLVRRDGVEAFLAAVERWAHGHRGEGFGLATSGPWPPYHFVPRLDHGE